MCSRSSLSVYLYSVLEELGLVESEICQNFPACFTLRREINILKEEGERLKVLTQPIDEVLEHSTWSSNFFNLGNILNPQQQRQKSSEFRQNMEKIHCLRRNIQLLKTLLAREVEKKNLWKRNDGYSCSESESSFETNPNKRTGNYSPNPSEVSSVSNASSYYQFF